MDDFEQHLADLYEVYGADVTKMPTANHILSGVVDFDIPSTFEQRYKLGRYVTDELIQVLSRYNFKANILTEAKLIRYFGFLKHLEVELQVVLLNDLALRGVDLTKSADFQEITDEFGEYFK